MLFAGWRQSVSLESTRGLGTSLRCDSRGANPVPLLKHALSTKAVGWACPSDGVLGICLP
jgi:hypothetical protein